MDPAVEIFYSVKANPALALCREFAKLGLGAEVASLGELETALEAGFSPDRIVFAGPGKTFEELKESVERGILALNVESVDEAGDIDDTAGRLGKRAGICVRVNPESSPVRTHQRMGGVPSPFGIDEEQLPEVLDRIRELSRVELRGIHVYVGNQIFDADLAVENAKHTLDIARKASQHLGGRALELIDLGGGLGVPYYKNESYLDVARFKEGLNRLVADARSELLFGHSRFILELGRYLVGISGILITRVLRVKTSRGKRFAVVDGGMHCCSIATGNLGQKIQRKFLLCPATRMDSTVFSPIDVVGPLCTPMDSFGHDYDAPELEEGDLLGVLFVGAYGLTASPTRFLSRFSPAEASVSQGRAVVTRQRENLADVLKYQRLFG